MARRKKRRRTKRDSFTNDLFGRAIRAVVAILVLTAFVLAIAFSIKQLSSVSAANLTDLMAPYLAKVGLGKEVGEVAGDFIERLTEGVSGFGDEEKTEESDDEGDISFSATVERLEPEGDVLFSLAIISDSHIANDMQEYIDNKDHLRNSLNKVEELEVTKLVHLGDLTNWGVLNDLKEAKQILDEAEVNYYALPGDRDLAQSVGTDNFLKVFGKNNFAFKEGGTKFVLLDNSANYTLISEETIAWFEKELADADFVLLSQPLYTEGLVIFNYLYMGSTDEEPGSEALAAKQAAVKEQRDVLLELIRESDVKAVIAGDHHKSSETKDSYLFHHAVGAVSGTVSEYAQSILQTQRFSLLKLYENGAYVLEDVTF